MFKMKKTGGFSLVELLVVIAIIAILATIAITSYNNYTEAAEKNTALTNYSRLISLAESDSYKCKAESNSTYVDGSQTCASLTGAQAATAITSYITSNLTNPYTNSANTVSSAGSLTCSSSNEGTFDVSSSGNEITVISCVDSNDSNKESTSFTI